MTLIEERPADANHRDPWLETIANSQWVNADQDKAAMPLSLRLAQPRASANTSTAALMSPRVFWIALAIAVLVLLGLIGKLLRKDAAPAR